MVKPSLKPEPLGDMLNTSLTAEFAISDKTRLEAPSTVETEKIMGGSIDGVADEAGAVADGEVAASVKELSAIPVAKEIVLETIIVKINIKTNIFFI